MRIAVMTTSENSAMAACRAMAALAAMLCLGVSAAQAQATRITTINPDTNSSNPSEFTGVGSTVFFQADDGIDGTELWKTDGTTGGTVLVQDICPGACSGDPNYLTNFNGALYFEAYDGTEWALWRSDGTSTGTVKVAGGAQGVSNPEQLTVVNSILFFTAIDPTGSWGIWKSDGTTGGTVELAGSAQLGSSYESPSQLTTVNGALFFTSYYYNYSTDQEVYSLWTSNGTAAGTVQISSWQNYQPLYLTAVSSTLFFVQYDGTVYGLWTSNGTSSGTVEIAGSTQFGSSGSVPSDLTAVNGTLYFTNDYYNSSTNQDVFNLWKSDGTTAGTVVVAGSTQGIEDFEYLSNVNGTLFFGADGPNNGWGLWTSDGTTAGTVEVAGGSLSSGYYLEYLESNVVGINGTAYFIAYSYDGSNWGYYLWKSDGTTAGTVLVAGSAVLGSSNYSLSQLTAVNGTLFFANNNPAYGNEPWISNGTTAGTVLLMDINQTLVGASPNDLINLNGALYFIATDANDVGLWKTNGTAAGTVEVAGPAQGIENLEYLSNVNGTLFFWASNSNSNNGWGLWTSDGTTGGTVEVAGGGLSSGYYLEYPESNVIGVNGTAYFIAYSYDGSNWGYYLWKSDGTTAGTVLVAGSAVLGSGSSYDYGSQLTAVNGALFFTNYYYNYTTQEAYGLWTSNGTSAGTVQIASWTSDEPSSLTAVNNTLFFVQYDGAVDGLWTSDGTSNGTVEIAGATQGVSNPQNLTNFNGTLFFGNYNSSNGTWGLWTSDGTSGGTVPVVQGLDPSSLTNVNGTLFFYDDYGTGLWTSDGTASGTMLVAGPSLPGPAQGLSSASELTNVNGTLFFEGYDYVHGYEPWFSFGTASSTELIQDIYPGSDSSSPSQFTAVGSVVVFAASDPVYGSQLWSYSPPATVTASVTAANKIFDGTTAATITGCTLSGVAPADQGNVSCSASGGAFSDPNVGNSKTVTATGIVLSGSAAGNYILLSTAPTTANITQASSTTTVTGGSFSYDGNPHPATVSVTGAGGLSLSPAPSYSGSCSSAPVTVAQGTSCAASYTYPGDANHTGSTGSAAVTITPTLVTVQVGSASLTYNGSSNTVQLSVNPQFAGVVLTYTSNSPVYNSTTGPTNPGTYTATASLTDSTDYAFSNNSQTSGTLTIAQAGQTIIFQPPQNQPLGSAPFTLGAGASSGLPVGFASLTTSVCTVSGATGTTVTLVTTGVCTIQATQTGNLDYAAAAPVNQSFEVTFQGLGATSLLVGSAGGSSSVALTYSGAWTASSNASFLHISAGSASGTGNAVVVFTIDPFAGTGTQTGTLTIAGLTLTVTQAGANYIGPAPVTTLVSSGLNEPAGVAVDGSGNVYIADFDNGAIKEWSASTQQVTTLVSSGLNLPYGIAVDGTGHVYITDVGNNAIYEWSAATQQVTTVVSSGLQNPYGVAVDGSGNIYIADTGNNAIKEWDAATQQVTTLVSSGLNEPTGVAVDGSGNIYIADSYNNAIKEWSAATQMVTTLVSSGLNYPFGVALDGSGNVYIVDTDNNAIKAWSASTQQVTTLVSSGLRYPRGVAVDGFGNVYIADSANNAIKEIPNAFVGPANGVTESAAAGSDSLLPVLPATASLTGIFAPTSDQSWLTIGTIAGGVINFSFTANTSTSSQVAHITVLGQSITVTQNSLTTQTITFNPLLNLPYGTAPFPVSATASSGLTVSFNSQTASVCTVSGSTVALINLGTCTIQATQPGDGVTYAAATPVNQSFQVTQAGQTITFGALTNQPLGTAPFAVSASASSGLTVGFASLTTSVCTVSGATVTLVTTGVCTIQATQTGNLDYAAAARVNQSFEVTFQGLGTSSLLVGSAGGSSSVVLTYSGAWTASSNASFLHISGGSASGTGNAVVVFTIDPFAGMGTRTGTLTIAGLTLTVTQAGTNYIGPGPATTLVSSGLKSPSGVAVDGSGNVYFADQVNQAIYEWSASTQQVTTLVSSGLKDPSGVAVDGLGNVYIADQGHVAVKEWNASTQQVTTLVSSGLQGPAGVAVDSSGNVYIADPGSGAIYEWSAATQQVTTLVSSGLSQPGGVAVDGSGNVYIADAGNQAIYEWSASTQQLTTLVPSGLNYPFGVAVDGSGNVYIADAGNQAIYEWSASTKQVTTLVSSGLSGPSGVAVDGSGNVYIADTGNKAIKELPDTFVGPAGGFTEPAAAGSGALLPAVPSTASLAGVFAPSSNQSWLTIGTVANGVVNFSFTANTTTSARAANISILGQSITVTQAGIPAGPPSVVSLSPTSGTGLTQTFTTVYSDPNGTSDLNEVLVLFNTSVSLANSCTVAYTPASNKMYLYNNAGTGLSAAVVPGSSNSASNSQCTLSGTGSSFSTSGNNLTLNVALTFAGTFVGQQNVYLEAVGKTQSSGWAGKGTWLPASAGPPTVVSLSPGSGTGSTQTFTMVYSDPNGISDLSDVLVLFNASLKLSSACAVVFTPGTNQLYLYNNAGTGVSTPVTPVSSGSASNSQCTLSGMGSSFSTSGNSLTLNVALTFAGTFLGQQDVYMEAVGKTANSGWVAKGTWLPASAGPPTVVSLAPATGLGLTQTFTMVYSDPNGISDLSDAVVLFNTSIKLSSSCTVVYVPASNLLYLYDNAGTALTTGIAPGSSGSVSNSQCTLAGTGSSFSTSGNNLTLSAALTFTPGFGGAQNVYLDAVGKTQSSGWVQEGTWTPSMVASLSPTSGTGSPQTFTMVYSDPNGTSDLNEVLVLLNTSVSLANSCTVAYTPASNKMYLYNNAGTGLSTAVVPGSSGSVSNSQCTLSGTGSSFSISGNNLTLNVALTFSGTFNGLQNVYLEAIGKTQTSSWVGKGTWTP
jgi:ELWxxDGT repeat protein